MPPSARKYGPVAYPKPPLAAIKRSSSVSLSELMGRMDSEDLNLLSESIALSGLSSNHSDSLEVIPPFPSGRRPSVVHFVSLRSNLFSSPRDISPVDGSSVLSDRGTVVTTGPTPPRLKTTLREVISIKKWRENALTPYAPGHVPWGDLADVPPKPWIFEGSMFSVDDYRAQRAELRQCRQLKVSGRARIPAAAPYAAQPVSDPGSRASVLPTSPPFRETLIFERDIILQTDGQPKRWSLRIPAKEMNPEMVDMMLELHDLKSYFGDKLKSDEGKKHLTEDALVTPTLVLSNSSLAIPISLDSSPRLASGVPLAIRRGKKVPAGLSFKDEEDNMPYPSMPTAFLGSPTSYSPKFEHANYTDKPSMNLDDMVASLRSRCASLGGCLPSVPRIYEEEGPSRSPRISMASFSEDPHGDEWAFADTIMDAYDDKFLSNDTLISTMLSNTSPSRFETAIENSTSPRANVLSSRGQLPRPSAQNFLDPVTPPPTIPLPSRPALSPTKHVRGILKSTKSVRFASLPDDNDNEPLAVPPHIPTLPSVVCRSPSPLRRSFERDVQEIRPGTPIYIAPARTAISRATPQKSSVVGIIPTSPTTRRASESSALRSIIRRPSIIVPSKKTASSGGQLTSSSLGRHSMGAKIGKENRARSSSTPVHPSRFVLDENTLKRAKEINARDSGSQKSRMPVAVRNILTRFK